MSFIARALILLIAGFAQSQSIAGLWDGAPRWWLQLVSLAVLAAVLANRTSWKQGLADGWIFATAWLCGTFWWLFISMHVYGGLASPLAVIAVLGLAAFLGSYYAAACAVYVALRGSRNTRLSAIARPAVFASAWLIAELARAYLWTGFPWGASGYAFVDTWANWLAPLVGVYGISFLAAGIASWIGTSFIYKRWIALGAAVVLSAAMALVPPPNPADVEIGSPMSVALLQGNIPQNEKFEEGTGVPQALAWYSDELLTANADLVVTPETAIPLLPQQLPADYFKAIIEKYSTGKSAALIGIPLGNQRDGYSNALVGIKSTEQAYVLQKHHLVPFGEFVPPFFRWFTNLMQIPLGDFNRGDVAPASFEWKGQRLAPNICYEDLFGEELAARFLDEANAPTIFVNVSNIGWFGNSIAIDQHREISRMRSLEFHRPMIRATNTGATVIIDASGRVTHSLPSMTKGVLLGTVRAGQGMTFFAWWASRFGLWPLFIGALLILGVYGAALRVRRP